MDISKWKDYLSMLINNNYNNLIDYLDTTPIPLRPKFQIFKEIPLSYVECINCKTEGSYKALCEYISNFDNKDELLNLVKEGRVYG